MSINRKYTGKMEKKEAIKAKRVHEKNIDMLLERDSSVYIGGRGNKINMALAKKRRNRGRGERERRNKDLCIALIETCSLIFL
jgi:hypothetical protein